MFEKNTFKSFGIATKTKIKKQRNIDVSKETKAKLRALDGKVYRYCQ